VTPLVQYIYYTGTGGVITSESIANTQDYSTAHLLLMADYLRPQMLLQTFYSHYVPLGNKVFFQIG
jgi:hypothetical protein